MSELVGIGEVRPGLGQTEMVFLARLACLEEVRCHIVVAGRGERSEDGRRLYGAALYRDSVVRHRPSRHSSDDWATCCTVSYVELQETADSSREEWEEYD